MLGKDVDFRQVYHKLCFISKDKRYYTTTEQFDRPPKANGTLTYAYIDHEAGLTYEILACARRRADGSITAYDPNDKVMVKYRAGAVDECQIEVIEDPELKEKYAWKINAVNKCYKADKGVLRTRRDAALDEYRHKHYPDDVQVVLLYKDNTPEEVWVRCEGILEDSAFYIGKLLNQPFGKLPVNEGDLIPFFIVEKDDIRKCFCLLSVPDAAQQK